MDGLAYIGKIRIFAVIIQSKTIVMKQRWRVLIAASVVILVVVGVSYWAFRVVMRAETNVRYAGLQSVVGTQLSRTIKTMEMSATNVFNEVEKHMDTPEAVIHALEEESNLNPDVRDYFAAFEPDFFAEKGRWFEPYIHHTDSTNFELSMVGSARHDYTQSAWYKRAKDIKSGFWSEPYFYYDGTNISGHYCTYVKPVYTADGRLACVCGADITFEWLTKALSHIDDACRDEQQVYKYRLMRDFQFFSIIIDHDGSCLVHPDGKKATFTNPAVLKDLQEQKAGMVEMEVDGEPSLVFYGPIDGIDWSVAVVAPKSDIVKPFNYMAWALLALAVIGIVAIWLICKRMKYAE